MKKAWRKFADRRPGTRFHQMYEEHQRAAKAGWVRVLWVVSGVAILAIGLVALPMPGPGTLIVALGAGLIARESSKLARALDSLEVTLRGWWRRLKARFARA
jgi:hypothetical protein